LVVQTALAQIFLRSRWALTLLGLGSILLLSFKKSRRNQFLGIALLFQFAGFSLMYVVSPLNVTGQLASSFYRLVIQVLPLLFWFAFARLKGEDESQASR
jgi:hypothetical protein